jgi:hypothetical protein
MKRTPILLILLALLMLVPASAQAAGPLVFLRTNLQGSAWIEQQSIPPFPNCTDTTCVHYPYPPEPPLSCNWDVDDWSRFEAYGTQPKGATSSVSTCVVADGYENYGGDNHRISVKVYAATPGMTVTLTNSQGLSWSMIPVYDSSLHLYLWTMCIFDRTGYPNPIDWYPVIAGSNGGTGIPVTYTLTLTAGDRDVRKVAAIFIDGSEGNTHWTCP